MINDNEVQHQYPPELLDNLDFNQIIAVTQNFIFREGRDKVIIRGEDQLAIAMATSLIDYKYELYKKQKENATTDHELQQTHQKDKPRRVGDVNPNVTIVPPPLHPVKPDDRRLPSQDKIIVTPLPKNPPSFHDDAGDDRKSKSSSSSLHEKLDSEPPKLVPRDPYPSKLSHDFIKDPIFEGSIKLCEKISNYQGGNISNENAALESRRDQIMQVNKNQSFGEDDSKNPSVHDSGFPPPPIIRQPSVDRTRSKVVESLGGTLNDTETLGVMQKLGYSKTDVQHIMHQLGPSASENDILEALVTQMSRNHQRISRRIPDVKEESAVERPVRDLSDSTPSKDDEDNLRTIIIDGSNVAMSYGNKSLFACKGIEIVVNWFLTRGHREIFVFVPNWRKEASKPDTPISDQHILEKLEKLGILVFTPSKRIAGRKITCYDDRYILNAAVDYCGIVVSNDNFRDLHNEKPDFKKVIEERVLMYSFVGKNFMPPDDPLGRDGPSLDNFLRKRPIAPDHPPQQCPYGKKCTYGNKCKYFHPEKPSNQKPISEQLKERDENRKRQQLLNGLLDYNSGEKSVVSSLNMHHNGLHTDPLPRQRSIDHTDPPPPQDSASYASQVSPHRIRTHHEPHPPPYIHSDPKGSGRYYSTEPFPQPMPAESGSGTVPLRHIPQHLDPRHQARHSSLPTNSAVSGVGGTFGELNAELAKLTLGGSSAVQDPRHAYHPAANPRYYGSPGQPHRPVTHTAPLPRPDDHQRRPYIPPHPSQDVYGPYAGNSHPLPPSGHPAHLQPMMHQYQHPSMYPNHPTAISLPTNVPPRLYPSLQSDGAINSYPNLQGARYENPHRLSTPHNGSSMDPRYNFMICFKDIYPEKTIREVLDKYPNETDHGRLHLLIQQHLNIRYKF